MDGKRTVRVLWLMLVYLVAAFPVAAGPTSSPQPDSAAKKEVLDINRAWADAEIKHDTTALRRFLDEKFVASFGVDQPYDKEAFIKLVTRSEADPTESQTLTDETVIVDGDTAVVVGTDTLRGTKNGTAYKMVGRYTATYIRRNGQWVALAEQFAVAPASK